MIFTFDDFELDDEHLEFRHAGKLLQADALVLRLLAFLVKHAGRLVSKEQLVDHVWDGRSVADNAITVSMARLRKLLGQKRGGPEYISTTYGRGYRFVREVAVRSAASSAPPTQDISAAAGPPFVGRERVLVQLRRALAEARSGRGRGCLLLGEPGIGKTRAVEFFARELAGTDTRVAWGFCREAGDTPPLWPWHRLLSDVLAVDGGATSIDALPEDLRGFLRGSRGEQAVPEVWATTVGGLATPERHRHFDTILRLFVRASEAAPVMLVIDDLHRADAASLELLVQLLDEIAHTRILVIATLRHIPGRRSAGSHLPHVLGHRNCERIVLDRLEQSDVAAYVRALLDDGSGALGRAVYTKSEGNPFFMTEFARALIDARHADPNSLAVPAAALELVRQRLARFDSEVRDVLSAAAVVGRSFELPLLAAVTERDPSRLMLALDAAIEAEVLVAAPDSMTAFAFGHALLREVLYDGLPAHEQRKWHLRIGQVLESRVAAGDSVPASELAYHFHAALPEGDPRTVVQHCRAAAVAAASVFAAPDVVRYARHALEALDLLERPSVRLRTSLLYLIAIFTRSYAPQECRQAISEVARLAQESGDPVMLLRAAMLLNQHPGLEPLPGQGPLLDRARVLFRPEHVGYRASTLATLALASPYSQSAAQSGELMNQAEALGRESGSRLALYVVLLCKLYLRGGPAHAAEAARTADELERLVVQNLEQAPALPLQLAMHRTVTAFQLGDLAALTAATERGSLRARALHNEYLMWHFDRVAAMTRIQFGAVRDATADLERLHDRAERDAIWGAPLYCAFDRAVTLAEVGHARPLDDQLQATLQYQVADPPGVWALKLRALAGSGRLDEARGALHVIAARDLAGLPCDRDYLGTLGHLTRTALALGESEYIHALYPLLLPFADQFAVSGSFLCDGSVAQLLGMLALATGRARDARGHLELGLRNNERAGLTLRANETRSLLSRPTILSDSGHNHD